LDNYRKLFLLTLAALTIIRLFLINQFELSPDEAYYWTWSRHLDWSYFDQGPMLALVIRFFTSLCGNSTEWSVRLGSVVLSLISSWFFFELIVNLFQNTRTAWYGFIAFQSALLISAGAVMMMHDSIMMCFWIAALYFFHRALFEHWTAGWISGSLALGLGALSKYTMALFVPCLLLFILLSPKHRIWWQRPHLYLAGLLTLTLVSPIIIWNIHHNWASFGHIGDLSGVEKCWSFSFKTIGNFIGGQLGVMGPLLALFCFAAPVIGWQKWRSNIPDAEKYLFLTCFSGPILLFFLLLSLRTEVYANWSAPAYPAAIALLAGWMISLLNSKHSRQAHFWATVSIVISLLMTVTAHLEVVCGILPLKGRAAHSVDRIRGWAVMGTEVGRLLSELQKSSRTKVFLAARRYQMGGILSFYTPGQPEVQLLPLREPANNQYRFWDQSAELAGQNALYVCEHYWEMEHIQKRFDRIETLPPFAVIENGRNIREIRFFYAYNFKPQPQSKTASKKNRQQGASLQ